MKKLMTFVAFIAMCVCGILNANAQSVDFSGTYTGNLTNVKMNQKDYSDVPAVTFTLTKSSDNTYQLKSSEIGPIGKMPGTITVDAVVSVDDLGNLSANTGETAGVLKTKIGLSFNIYMTGIVGNLNQSPLSFQLDTYALKILGFEAFDASVTFTSSN